MDHHGRSSVKGHKSSIKEGNALKLGTSQLKHGRFFFELFEGRSFPTVGPEFLKSAGPPRGLTVQMRML